MHNVFADGVLVAIIVKTHHSLDAYDPAVPWVLLRHDGVRLRFWSFAEAKEQAQKEFPGAKIKRA